MAAGVANGAVTYHASWALFDNATGQTQAVVRNAEHDHDDRSAERPADGRRQLHRGEHLGGQREVSDVEAADQDALPQAGGWLEARRSRAGARGPLRRVGRCNSGRPDTWRRRSPICEPSSSAKSAREPSPAPLRRHSSSLGLPALMPQAERVWRRLRVCCANCAVSSGSSRRHVQRGCRTAAGAPSSASVARPARVASRSEVFDPRGVPRRVGRRGHDGCHDGGNSSTSRSGRFRHAANSTRGQA